ncbi:MAG: DNA repair protein RecN [Firmicutes bacterium]|nr:DNA repair protein RecN [Bacillota bacterium]
MIDHIAIKNFAIIENTEMDLKGGLNIITGETGAGKSIVIEAVSLALGSRADSSCIRTGADKAVVELTGSLNGEDIVIHREVNRQGKNLIKLNGEIVTLNQLNRISSRLADIHGQYDNQSLLDPDYHIVLLDSYRSEKVAELKETVARDYHEFCDIKSRLISLLNQEKQNRRDLDFHRFEAEEIDRAELWSGEDTALEEKINLLKNSEKIYEGLENAYSALSSDGAVLDELSKGMRSLEGISRFSSALEGTSSEYTDLFYRLQDLSRDLGSLLDSISFSQAELDEAITRLSLLDALKKKYSMPIDGILEYRNELEQKIHTIENFDSEKTALEHSLIDSRKRLLASCAVLTEERKKAASDLSERALKELLDLNFQDARIEISVSPLDQPQEDGMDRVEILISTNKGEPLKPLYKVASGGEISRIMLAFKNVISTYDAIPTLIFDEIDNGISGVTASVVSGKLREIARAHQIVCITHLPQIAAAGDHNYKIYKDSDNSATYTHIESLDEEQKVSEIARLIGGANVTETTLSSAKELIASCCG